MSDQQARKDAVKVSTCRACNARIYWTLTASFKRLPVDVDPVPNGNVMLTLSKDDEGKDILRSEVIGKNTAPPVGRNLYMPHFDTCPNYKRK